jgi:hypothetical protein
MPAAVSPAAMETASTANVSPAATTVEASPAAANTAAAARYTPAARKSTATIGASISAPVPAAAVSVVVAATVTESAATVAPPVEPWTGADKDAADEVVRAVISVRSASVGGVPVVAVSTNRCRSNIPAHWPHADAYANAYLCTCVTRCKHANRNQNRKSYISHFLGLPADSPFDRDPQALGYCAALIPLQLPHTH